MNNAKNIVVLTGAGISAESGIRTFRAADGLWEEHRIEDVATPEGFARDPQLVHRFYNTRRAKLAGAQPNAAHIALAEFEARHTKAGGGFLLVTQNIDDLHERGGSVCLRHMHGELLRAFCSFCNEKLAAAAEMSEADKCPRCERAGGLRPDIVWFGEMPYFMNEIGAALASCDLFVSIGTSGAVYPAAGFVRTAKMTGARCVQLNLESTGGEDVFDETVFGKATEIVPAFFGEIG